MAGEEYSRAETNRAKLQRVPLNDDDYFMKGADIAIQRWDKSFYFVPHHSSLFTSASCFGDAAALQIERSIKRPRTHESLVSDWNSYYLSTVKNEALSCIIYCVRFLSV